MTKQMSGSCDLDDALAQQELVRSQNPAGPWYAIRSKSLYWSYRLQRLVPKELATWYSSRDDFAHPPLNGTWQIVEVK